MYKCSRCDGDLTVPESRNGFVWVDDSNDVEGGRMELSLELLAQTHICDPEQVASELFKASRSLKALIDVQLPRWSARAELARLDNKDSKYTEGLERKVASIKELMDMRRAKIEELS